MNELYSNYIKKSLWITIAAFIVRCALSWKSLMQGVSIYDLFGFAGESIAFSAFADRCSEGKEDRNPLPCGSADRFRVHI